MADWCLLVIDNTSHLVNLDLKILDIKKFGSFPSDFLKKQELGVSFDLFGKKSVLLPHSLPDIQKNLVRGPQIILPKDIAWLVYSSDIKSNDVVVEAGGGSGALTTALAQAAFPNGKIITFERSKKHFEIVKRNLEMSHFSGQVELRNEDLTDETQPISCNSIILDLPDPQLLISWAEKSLLLGGKLSCYIPTINQVEDLLSSLSNWSEIEINEMMHRKWQSKIDAIRPETNMLGHTGFIVSARLLNK
ncbi:MAG: methyltransferase domain-containing protein [Candidatus Poseidoniia archaeon]|nr:methyltransferase domain-containing protein [Candidatus Poseidoniia archaeon]